MGDGREIHALKAELEAARRAAGRDGPEPAAAAPALDAEALLSRAEKALEGLDEDIARHPRVAVLAALTLGLVIGSLLSR